MLSINFFCISNQFLCNWWQHIATETNHSVSCIIHAQGRTKNPKISVLPPFPKFPPSNAGFAGGTLANVQCNLFCVTCYHRQIVIFCKGKLMSHVGIVYIYSIHISSIYLLSGTYILGQLQKIHFCSYSITVQLQWPA